MSTQEQSAPTIIPPEPPAPHGPVFKHDRFLTKAYGFEVAYDTQAYHALLDELGIGPEREQLEVRFLHMLNDAPDPDRTLARYNPDDMSIDMRVLKQKWIFSYLWSRKEKPMSPEELNKRLIHETRHFFQHLGALAAGERYEWHTKEAKNRVETDAKKFAEENHKRFSIITGIQKPIS